MGANASHQHEPLGDHQRAAHARAAAAHSHGTGGGAAHYARASIRKSLRKKKKQRQLDKDDNNKENQQGDDHTQTDGRDPTQAPKVCSLRRIDLHLVHNTLIRANIYAGR